MDARIERKITENAYKRRATLVAAREIIVNAIRQPHINDETEIVESRNGAWVTCKLFVTGREIREAGDA